MATVSFDQSPAKQFVKSAGFARNRPFGVSFLESIYGKRSRFDDVFFGTNGHQFSELDHGSTPQVNESCLYEYTNGPIGLESAVQFGLNDENFLRSPHQFPFGVSPNLQGFFQDIFPPIMTANLGVLEPFVYFTSFLASRTAEISISGYPPTYEEFFCQKTRFKIAGDWPTVFTFPTFGFIARARNVYALPPPPYDFITYPLLIGMDQITLEFSGTFPTNTWVDLAIPLEQGYNTKNFRFAVFGETPAQWSARTGRVFG